MDFKMRAATIFLVFLTSQVYTREVDFCFAEEDDPYLYMGTKTAYHFVHAGKTRFQDVPNCQAEQIWMLTADGTSCPKFSEILEMLNLTQERDQILHNHETRNNGHMCNRDLDKLRKWKPDAYLVPGRADVLTPQGVEDMRLLARRLQSNFPQLLSPNSADAVTPDNYKFKTTDARDSMGSFMEGLFGNRTAVTAEEGSVNDTLLTAYKTCTEWSADQSDIVEEVEKFDAGPEFQALVQNVSRRLGYLYNISERRILTMYDMCRYEKAWTVTQLSPWCAVFSKEELRVLEYREDLHYYYKSGYGREINAQLGCSLVQDMMNHFWKVQNDHNSMHPKGIFYFSDIISLQNLLTSLDINKDRTRLTANDYRNMAKREWRTSFISSFAANLVAVFYKCEGNTQPSKVMFYVAEKPVLLDGCEVGLCDFEYLRKKYSRVISNCKPNGCGYGSGASSVVTNFILITFACLSLVLLRQ